MARFRLARPARADIAGILATSAERWGPDARRRYESLLATALRHVADDPRGPLTRDRSECAQGLRSFHLRHARANASEVSVRGPVHVIYFRAPEPGLVEIVRVLHERMEPSLHVGASRTAKTSE